jgi:hypothetical protein
VRTFFDFFEKHKIDFCLLNTLYRLINLKT